MERKNPLSVWNGFWFLAQAICREIETNTPDVVIVLHCSGAVAWHAVRTLWEATRTEPLPPVAAILVGQSTADAFVDRFEPNEWEYMGEDLAGRMLAWIAQQDAWQAALRSRLHAALGEREPASVLLVDDVVHDGWTALTALGLVWAVLPGAQARLWAGLPLDWREVLGQEWMHTFHAETARQMAAGWEQDKAELFAGQPWRTPNGFWPQLVSGLVDGEEPLASIPLAQALPNAAYLTRYLAQEEWLAFSAWVYDMVAAQIRAHARDATRAPQPPPDLAWRLRAWRLGAEELIWAVAWQQRWSTAAEFCRLCNLAEDVVEKILCELVSRQYFVTCEPACGEARAPRYYGRKYQTGILAIDPDGDAMRARLQPYVTDAVRVATPFVDEQGVRLCGLLLILDRDWEDADNVKNLLCACALGEQEEYARRKGSEPWGALDATIGCLKEFAGVTEVFYTRALPADAR